jgi:transposase
MNDKAEKIALFRYGLIAPLVLETLPRGELTRRAQEIAARLYDIPHSTRRQVSVDTLLEWTLRYRRNGLTALTPKPRLDRGQQRAVAPETAALIERLKRENPHRTGTALLRELAPANGQDHTGGLSASTLYRFLRARGLTERQLLLDKAAAHKKYEAEFANQTWQSDMLFGPWVQRAGPGGYPGKMQVFLQATLDDASRLIPHAQFYPNQGLDSFLDCLRQAIAARGIPTRLYMDNAKIYRSPGVPSGPGAHRRLHRHPHHSHAALSARRPRQDRTFLPFGARAVSRLARPPSAAVAGTVERAPLALARHRLSSP